MLVLCRRKNKTGVSMRNMQMLGHQQTRQRQPKSQCNYFVIAESLPSDEANSGVISWSRFFFICCLGNPVSCHLHGRHTSHMLRSVRMLNDRNGPGECEDGKKSWQERKGMDWFWGGKDCVVYGGGRMARSWREKVSQAKREWPFGKLGTWKMRRNSCGWIWKHLVVNISL
jgi:hypothetical protein